MYEYKFVEFFLMKPPSIIKNPSMEDYHETIRQHAQQGWRLVQIFSRGSTIQGAFELIFERPIE